MATVKLKRTKLWMLPSLARRDHRKSKFGLCHDIRLIELSLCHDEVRILIFDDLAEQEGGQRPVMVRSGRGPFRPERARRARAMHELSP